MQAVWIKKLGFHRGRRRLWIESRKLAVAGMLPGMRYHIEHLEHGVRLRLKPDGTHQVSRKQKGEREIPIIDINSDEWLAPLHDCDVVRIVLHADGLYVLRPASVRAQRERLERLAEQLRKGEVHTGSIAHGGGILSHACHQGLQDEGIKATLRFAVEIDETYLEQSLQANDATSSQTVALAAPLQEIVQDDWVMQHLPKVEVLEMGLPCSGASRAGKSKRGLSMMEDHPEVGHLVHAALCVIQRVQPSVIVLENVEDYAVSASAQILRHQLRDMGYEVREHVLNARDFGCLEARVRWALVATTAGLPPIERIEPEAPEQPARLGDLLESVAEDDARWSDMAYLKDKEQRDIEAGKGFRMQVVDANATSVPTIRKAYNKGGSTDPYVAHPSKAGLMRKFTAREHARIKGVPEHLVEGLSETAAHEILGQGIAYAPFRSLFRAVGACLVRFAQSCRDGAEALGSGSALAQRVLAVTG